MYTNLHVLGDATEWTVSDEVATTLRQAAVAHADPIAVPLLGPVEGQLILSVHALGALVVLPVPPERDWMPSYTESPQAALYLPSDAGVTGTDAGYPLPSGTDLTALEQRIVAAMRDRHRIEVDLVATPGSGVVLNGATLTLVALLRAS